jgi:4'-phosphopantetheinyl transferase
VKKADILAARRQLMNFLKRSTPLHLASFEKALFWLVNLQEIHDEEIEEAKKLLDQEAIDYAERFKAKEERHRALLFHALARKEMGDVVHCSPKELIIVRPPRGRPHLRDFSLHFNLSHTKQFGLIAVHPTHPIGVDIEEIKNDPSVLDIAKSHFHLAERKEIEAAKNPIECFYSFWCAREALLKALGTGFFVKKLPELHAKEVEGMELFKWQDGEIHVYSDVVKNHKLAVCVIS